ncbi:8794_t:CDS:1, partial [Ambispora gerdemannii]
PAKETAEEENNHQTQTELDPITKFQQRQAQANSHAKPNSEPAVNNSATS